MNDGDRSTEARMTVWLHEDPPSLDSQMVVDDWSWRVHSLCLEGLTRRDPHGRITPGAGLAESWESSEDHRRWTFTLRQGLCWSDGEPLTAEHVLHAVRRSADPRTPRRSAWSMYVIDGVRACHRDTDGSDEHVEAALDRIGVEVLDPRRVRFDLTEPVPFLPGLLSLPSWAPLRPDVPPPSAPEDVTRSVYSGPYVMAEYTVGERIRYRRNPRYWDADRVAFDEVEVLLGGDPLQLYLDGTLDVVTVDATDTSALAPDELERIDEAAVVYLVCNTKDPVLADRDLRRSIAGAIDREAVAAVGMVGSSPATGLVPPAIDRGAFRAAADPGLPEVTGSGQAPAGTTLHLMCGDTPGNIAEAEAVAEQLHGRLGITVEVEPNGFMERFVRIRDADYQLAIVAWKADYDDAFGLLVEHTSDGAAGNQSKWSDDAYNALLAQARSEADADTRRSLLVRAEAMLLEHAGIQPLLYRGRYWAVRPGIRGLVHVAVGPSPELRWATREVPAPVA